MELIIHENTSALNSEHPVLYFKQAYLKTQDHSQLIIYKNNNFELHLVINEENAISIPRSPFGSVFCTNSTDINSFHSFINEVKSDLKTRNVKSLELRHPAGNYASFVPSSWISDAGFQVKYHDISQYIELSDEWENKIHEMQSRKLKTLRQDGFIFRKMEESELETAHQFVAACRRVQELEINISFDRLDQLSKQTKAYDCFGIFRDDKISALTIIGRVDQENAYYYLPATAPTFRNQSPMVLLLAEMVKYYHNKGVKHLDLGVSSIMGKPQESLRIFKNRMGAQETQKTTWEIAL